MLGFFLLFLGALWLGIFVYLPACVIVNRMYPAIPTMDGSGLLYRAFLRIVISVLLILTEAVVMLVCISS